MNKYLIVLCLFLNDFQYNEPYYGKLVDNLTKLYLKEFADSHGLSLRGYGGAMMGDIQSVNLSFVSTDSLDVEDARILFTKTAEEYIHRMNCYKEILPYLHNFPFEIKNVDLQIAFKDQNGRARSDGKVSYMFVVKENIVYYKGYDSKTEEFYPLNCETYEEALERAKLKVGSA